MDQNFPYFSKSLGQMLLLQSTKLTPAEHSKVKNNKLWNDIMACKETENKQKNIQCLLQAYSANGCKSEFESLIRCTKYIVRPDTPDEFKTKHFCIRQDSNFGHCISKENSQLLKLLHEANFK